ncbi:hypothetical protein F5B20DRAFT_591252 [Whalleya microplaca]|nr:hypothetical protein F5B20DRAFT_591252 [Whalleya microplaca]
MSSISHQNSPLRGPEDSLPSGSYLPKSFAWDRTALERTCHDDQVDSKGLLACGELGDLLAVTNQTCKAIESAILPTDEPCFLTHMEAMIGFSENDCASFLGQSAHNGGSDAGVKFLALTSALVTAFDSSECAEVLLATMQKLMPQRAPHPTVAQLSQVMAKVEGRCNLSGFADLVVQYEIEMCDILRQKGHRADALGRIAHTPPKEAVVKLVEHFSQLKLRACGSGSCTLKLVAYACAPWLAAFVHWCLSEPLVVPEHPDQEAASGWAGFRISIVVKRPTNDAGRVIEVMPNMSDLDVSNWLFNDDCNKYYCGLITVQNYFQLVLTAFKLDKGPANKAALEAIPYALYQARYGLTMCFEECVDKTRCGAACETTRKITEWKSITKNRISSDKFEHFPSRAGILNVLHLIKGLENAHMKSSNKVGTIFSLSQVKSFLVNKKFESEREEWLGGLPRQAAVDTEPGSIFEIFEEQISQIIATILAVSLFKDADMVMLSPDTHIWKSPELMPSSVISAIRNTFHQREGCCDATEWHRVCRKLAGHGQELQGQKSPILDVISCSRGQVVFSDMLARGVIPGPDESFLALHWFRGDLKVKDKMYKRIVGNDTRQEYVVGRQQYRYIEKFSHNAYPWDTVDYALVDAAVPDIGLLSLAMRDEFLKQQDLHADPCGVIKNLASAECLKQCEHKPDAPPDTRQFIGFKIHLCHPDETSPWWNEWAKRASDDELSRLRIEKSSPEYTLYVIPVGGSDLLRFYSLAKPIGAHVAVRQNACVSCCIRFCKETGLNILVL